MLYLLAAGSTMLPPASSLAQAPRGIQADGSAVPAAGPAEDGVGNMQKRPNILIIMTDQHSPHVLGCYGNHIVRTPNLDALARRGTIFANTYCAAPLCVPSRMSFLTGRSPSENQVWANSNSLASDRPTFAHALSTAGYDTALIGRMHFLGPDQHHGFGSRLVGDVIPAFSDDRIPLSRVLLRGAGDNSLAAVTTAGHGKTAYQAFDRDVTKAAVDFLHSAAKQKQPFCAVVGFVLPHSPLVCSKFDWDYYLNRVTLPKVPPGYFEHLHPAVKTWREERGVADLTDVEVRRARAGYYGLVTEVDRNVGTVLSALKDSGLEEETIVIYTSDHGDMDGENGMWWKFNFYEGSVKVPLIVSRPGHHRTDSTALQVVSLIDIAPTLCDLAGAPAMPNSPGRILTPLLDNENVDWVNQAFSELPAIREVPATRMVRKDEWKLVHFDGMRPQLFNLKRDPHEFYDLGDDPSYSRVRNELLSLAESDWSPRDISLSLSAHARNEQLMARWAKATHPSDPMLWKAPAGANVFSKSN